MSIKFRVLGGGGILGFGGGHQDRIYPHPLGDRNSDHGLSFPFPET